MQSVTPPVASGRTLWAWCTYCAGFLLFAVVLTSLSREFGGDRDVGDMPIVAVVGLLVVAGLGFAVLLPGLIRRSEKSILGSRILLLVVMSGLAARLICMTSEPVLENDYYRYLWDGAVVAAGYNPYEHSPRDIIRDGETGPLGRLANEGEETLSRIGHKSLTTIYPPFVQLLFAVANVIQPWSLVAWRSVLLVLDVVSLFLLIKLLDLTGRSRVWAALYWLNPLVLKEGFNSAHMEPALIPLVLGAMFLAATARNTASTVVLALAAGIKLWPAALAPLIWRPLVGSPFILALNAIVFSSLMVFWVAPLLLSAPLESAGLKAYAEGWSTNSALSPALEKSIKWLLTVASIDTVEANVLARFLVTGVLCGLALLLAMREWRSLDDLIRRVSVFVMALVLLSPAQYPWYALWLAPLLVFWPHRAFLFLSATLPLYYLSFHFAARDAHDVFTSVVVWVIWCPVWMMIAYGILMDRLPAGIENRRVKNAMRV
ncbi:MAG: glycosyltransferase 87 family protein [Hyphomicrobium sp.]|nr:glycosyltransferase 87 family protein [Hyphomicrobium sp.]